MEVMRGRGVGLLAWIGLACCGGAAAPAEEPEVEGPAIGLVSSEVVLERCPDAKRMSARAAQTAIRRLVEPCSTVPGGAAHFSATLLPGGRIELASPEGDPAEGMVPTCALTHQLQHKLKLSKACKLDVRLEERSVPPR